MAGSASYAEALAGTSDVLVGGQHLVLVPATGRPDHEGFVAAITSATTVAEWLGRLLAHPIGDLPAFGFASWTAGVVHIAVRGDVQAQIYPREAAPFQVDGNGLATWFEHRFDDTIGVALTSGPLPDGVAPTPVAPSRFTSSWVRAATTDPEVAPPVAPPAEPPPEPAAIEPAPPATAPAPPSVEPAPPTTDGSPSIEPPAIDPSAIEPPVFEPAADDPGAFDPGANGSPVDAPPVDETETLGDDASRLGPPASTPAPAPEALAPTDLAGDERPTVDVTDRPATTGPTEWPPPPPPADSPLAQELIDLLGTTTSPEVLQDLATSSAPQVSPPPTDLGDRGPLSTADPTQEFRDDAGPTSTPSAPTAPASPAPRSTPEPSFINTVPGMAPPPGPTTAGPPAAHRPPTAPRSTLKPRSTLTPPATPRAASIAPHAAVPGAPGPTPPLTSSSTSERPLIQAIRCPGDHLNPPHADTCRVCGESISERVVALVARPAVGWLVFPDGRRIEADRPLLFGRNPSGVTHTPDGEPVTPITLPDPEQLLSRTHAEVRIVDWQLQVVDRDSRNGTFVTVPGRPPFRLHPGDPYPIPPGSTVTLGDAATFTFHTAAT